MINWKVRIKNKNFWIAIIPAVLVFIQLVASIFGLEIRLDDLGNKLIDVVNALFVILAIIGVVNDPTTSGISDSARAMTYRFPNPEKPDRKEEDAA